MALSCFLTLPLQSPFHVCSVCCSSTPGTHSLPLPSQEWSQCRRFPPLQTHGGWLSARVHYLSLKAHGHHRRDRSQGATRERPVQQQRPRATKERENKWRCKIQRPLLLKPHSELGRSTSGHKRERSCTQSDPQRDGAVAVSHGIQEQVM